jgi:hydroxypyruvate isomerase
MRTILIAGRHATVAVNLSFVYRGSSFASALDAAVAAGFHAIEFWWPSSEALGTWSMDRLAREIERRDLTVVAMNLPAGDMDRGERGLAADRSRRAEFANALDRGLSFASRVGCHRLNALAGNAPAGKSRRSARSQAIEGLRLAAERALEADIEILIEPLNSIDHPAYVFATAQDAADAARAVDLRNAGVLLDAYHVTAGGDDLATAIRTVSPIRHVQLADWPGRHEPGSGRIDFVSILNALDQISYVGDVALEFDAKESGRPNFDAVAETLGLAEH